MRHVFYILSIASFGFLFLSSCSQTDNVNDIPVEYASFAQSAAGGHYVIGFLSIGAGLSEDASKNTTIMNQHNQVVVRLVEQGKILGSMPLKDTNQPNTFLMYVFNVKNTSEAQQLMAASPAIKAGNFALSLHDLSPKHPK